jgi:hypothetical protein
MWLISELCGTVNKEKEDPSMTKGIRGVLITLWFAWTNDDEQAAARITHKKSKREKAERRDGTGEERGTAQKKRNRKCHKYEGRGQERQWRRAASWDGTLRI